MPELRETVLLDIAAAQRQITQLESQLDALASPVVVPVEVEGTQAIQDLRRQVDAADDTIDLNVDTAGLDRADDALSEVRKELEGAKTDLTQAQGRAAQLREELERTSREGVGAFGRLRQAVGPLIATLAAGIGIRAFVRQIGDAVNAASDLEQAAGGLEAVFGDAGVPLQRFAETAAQAVGLTEEATLTLGARLGGQLQTFGFEAAEAATKTRELIETGADLAATYGGPVSDAVDAISSLLRGETNPIERYAIAINQTAINAKALALGLAESAGQITLQDKAVAALALLSEQSARAQGQFGREAETTAGKVERLRAEIGNASAEIGEAFIPAYEAILEATPRVIQAFTDAGPAIASLAEDVIGLAAAASTVIDPLADVVGVIERATDADIEDVFGQLVDSVQGTDEIGRAGENVARFLGLFDVLPNLGTAAAQFEVFRNVINEIVRDAADGVGPIDLLNEAFTTLTAQGVEFTSAGLDVLQQSAGATNDQFRLFLQSLLAQRDGLGLTADSIKAISAALNEVNEEFQRGGLDSADAAVLNHVGTSITNLNLAATDLATSGADRALLNLATGVDAVTEASGALPPFIGDLQDLQRAADDAGVGVLAFLQSIDDADNITIDLSQVETDLLGLIETLGRASFDLSANIGEAFGVGGTIDEETKKIPGDVATFLETLQSDIEEQTDFEIDLSAIQVVAPDLAQALADQGIDVAADIAAAFAADPEAAAKAQELLDGTAEQLATGTAEAYAGFLKDLTPQQVADLGVFGAENFISPAVQAQLAETADTLAKELLDLIDTGISGQTIAPEIIIDLSQAQIDLATLPSLQGNPVSVRVPGAQTETGSTGSPTGGGGVRDQALVVNINNATTNDVTGSGAQAAQTIASVSRNLWRGN